ncbi:MAG: CAP domain-containing protein [Candidatus Paceibacterota bacterium]
MNIISAINRQRKSKHLNPVSHNNKIDIAAKIQAKQMARTGQFGHVLRGVKYPNLDDRMRASSYALYKAGEVLFTGNEGPDAIVGLWIGSKPHREAILHPDVKEIGASVEYSSGGKSYVCAVLCVPFEGNQNLAVEVADKIINIAKEQGAIAAKKILNDIMQSKPMRWIIKTPPIQRIIAALK